MECKEIKLTVPWGHVAARTYGPSTGERILLVHGRLDNAGSFNRLMEYLPMGFFYYVCIDLPGHGWSSHFPSWVIQDCMIYAHTIHFILEALQWEKCIYIGHSMGAQIGLIFSIFQPDKIKKVIALDGFLITVEGQNIAQYIETASALSIKASSNIKPVFYTKEEVLYAFKTLRVGPLNSEAANALFERAVTKNGKYIYNRDIRLKNSPFSYMSEAQANDMTSRISVPIYVLAASDGILCQNERMFMSAVNSLNAKTTLQIIIIEGSHDVHNNNPERVAPFVRKILTSSNSSKL
ncbi:serine hydrolase-like protein [Anoplolepis gracilipes]|uniref:serine hydrolase-like protein n=1 Tax=Anoplolepis gracilipes TaxID=354296 RepID=UPI003B9F758C